jgi:O-antigen ligase
VIGHAFEARMPRLRRTLPSLAWAAVGAVGAFTIALSLSASLTAGIAAAVAIGAGVAIAIDPAFILVILAASIFLEEVRVEGATVSRVLAPIALFTFVLQLVRGRASIRVSPPLLWALAYGVWAIASGLWTESVSGTLVALASLGIALTYMLSFASLSDSPLVLRRVLWTLVLASFLLGVLSFPQVSEPLHLGQLLKSGRSQGGVGDPNYFAATQLVVLSLVIVLTAEAKKRWVQLGLYAVVLVIIGSILSSLSRGGFLGLAVLLALFVVVPFRVVFRSRRRKAVALVALALGLAAVSAREAPVLRTRLETLIGNKQPSGTHGSGRVDLWKAAMTGVHEHPWLGLGYGAFRRESRQLLLTTPGVDLETQPPNLPNQPAHNTYL